MSQFKQFIQRLKGARRNHFGPLLEMHSKIFDPLAMHDGRGFRGRNCLAEKGAFLGFALDQVDFYAGFVR
jgi:hypothetical protein